MPLPISNGALVISNERRCNGFSCSMQSPAVPIVSVEYDERERERECIMILFSQSIQFSRIYGLVNVIIHLLNERLAVLAWHTNDIYTYIFVLCLCVSMSDKRLLPYQAIYFDVTFSLFHTIAACIIISIHSPQLNAISQDDEVNAVFFCNDSLIPKSS